MNTAEKHTAKNDIYLFNEANMRKQMESAEEHLGYKILYFYVDNAGIISRDKTEQTDRFYLLPSGGTLRDKNMNIVQYSARFDDYKGLGKVSD